MFECGALRAIHHWRYSPSLAGGEAMVREGLRVVIRFDLERS
jgi:hypothetical protein